jgi:hypothetical protein
MPRPPLGYAQPPTQRVSSHFPGLRIFRRNVYYSLPYSTELSISRAVQYRSYSPNNTKQEYYIRYILLRILAFYFVKFYPAVYVYLIVYYFNVSLTQPINICEYSVQIIMLWLRVSAYCMPSSGHSGVLRYN